MRRHTVLVLVTVGLLALAGCQGGGSSAWTQQPGDRSPSPSPSPEVDELAACLEGSWSLDEAVLAAMAAEAFVDDGSDPEVTMTLDRVNADQIVTFFADETFTSTTDMTINITYAASGQTAPGTLTMSTSSAGTWYVSDGKLSTETDGNGTGQTTVTVLGTTETSAVDGADELVMLPERPFPVTCSATRMTVEGVGMSTGVADIPSDFVFTRS
ncbi:MAG: hypothetical protein FWD11_01995 [Micrococcales bacterium]|nr:hypothetical protein [Micrococcales bacterium]